MRTKIHIIAWTLLALAFCAWGAVWYAGTLIVSEATALSVSAATAEQQLDRLAYAQRLDSLAADTEAERNRLTSFTHADVISIINIIESVGKGGGVSAHVSDALPIGSPQMLPGDVPLQSIQFVVGAQGSFSALMRTVEALEHLPLPSSIDQIEFQRDAGSASKSVTWRLTVRVRVITTAAVSS